MSAEQRRGRQEFDPQGAPSSPPIQANNRASDASPRPLTRPPRIGGGRRPRRPLSDRPEAVRRRSGPVLSRAWARSRSVSRPPRVATVWVRAAVCAVAFRWRRLARVAVRSRPYRHTLEAIFSCSISMNRSVLDSVDLWVVLGWIDLRDRLSRLIQAASGPAPAARPGGHTARISGGGPAHTSPGNRPPAPPIDHCIQRQEPLREGKNLVALRHGLSERAGGLERRGAQATAVK